MACDTGATVLRSPDGGMGSTDDGGTDAGLPALPACWGDLERGNGSFGPFTDAPVGTVQARGEVTYTQLDLDDGADPIDLDATLSAVDMVTSSITLTSATGTTVVYLGGMPLPWLAQVPTGGRVHARFEHGIVVTDAASDWPLLALRTIGGSIRTEMGIDVGPMHFVQGSSECIYAWACFGGGGSPGSSYVGIVDTGVEVSGAMRGRPFRVRVLESTRQASVDEVTRAIGAPVCLPLYMTAFSIAYVDGN